jgi:rhodanese-related sulfurtransferase
VHLEAGEFAVQYLQKESDDLIVLDVREPDAFEAGHIPGARLLPRHESMARSRLHDEGGQRTVSMS